MTTPPAAIPPTHANPNTGATPAAVNLTHGYVDAPKTPAALDLALGDRPETRCGGCNRHLPAIEPGQQRFELEDADTGRPLCDVCANRRHHPLRLAVALLNAMVEAYAAGDKKSATEAVEAITNGFSMLQAEAPRVAYRRPVRQQPRRAARRGRRR